MRGSRPVLDGSKDLNTKLIAPDLVTRMAGAGQGNSQRQALKSSGRSSRILMFMKPLGLADLEVRKGFGRSSGIQSLGLCPVSPWRCRHAAAFFDNRLWIIGGTYAGWFRNYIMSGKCWPLISYSSCESHQTSNS